MVLESTMICVDNSDYMRNGDFVPTRLQALQDAVNLVCHTKTRSNPENNVGLITLANRVEVKATLTADVGRILAKLHQVQPGGEINFSTGLRIAHLALKHRQGKNHKMRIVAFIGSPIMTDEKEVTKLAKRLKKEKVNVDIVSFGEDELNNAVLTAFINALNGKDGVASHLVTIPPGPHLSDALISSPVIQTEDGVVMPGLSTAGYEFGVDPNEDPELALALRVSMEEQRQRQEQEGRRTQTAGASEVAQVQPPPPGSTDVSSEEAMLERALAMSMEPEAGPSGLQSEIRTSTSASASTSAAASSYPDFDAMTEEEQIEFAMRMSMQENTTQDAIKPEKSDKSKDEAMEVEYATPVADTEFLKSVLEGLPGMETVEEPQNKKNGGNNSSSKKNSDKSEDGKEQDKSKEG